MGTENWNRSPYFIEVWFNGYNLDGTIMSPTLYYTLYRVSSLDINVKVTEGGSVYDLSGVFDGDIGHSLLLNHRYKDRTYRKLLDKS